MNASFVFDIPLMIGVMALLTVPSLIRGKLARWQGVSLLLLYVGYCVLQFVLIPMFP
jgi:cation:H+ antiporter